MPLKNDMQVSRYASYFLLLSKEEQEDFFPEGMFVILGKVLDDPIISRKTFLSIVMQDRMDTVGFALSKDHFEFINIPGKGVIARKSKPVIEIKPFAFMISSDGKLLENVFGRGSVDFGIAVSYPGLFSDGETIEKTRKRFAEAEIFHQMRGFIRKETVAAKFDYAGQQIIGSFRIGKKNFDDAKRRMLEIEGLELRI